MARIMIADDMDIVLHNVGYILKQHNHQVVGRARDCNEALTVYRKCRPDLLLLDILGMKSYSKDFDREINSFDLIKIIKQEDPQANIIILTASPRENLIKDAMLSGARGFIVKGISNEKILETIENVLQKSN